MSPDTIQNITIALKLLVQHNFVAIGCFIGIIISTTFALISPKRGLILLMVGFSLSLLGFEYQKHIKESLYEQTRNSIITQRESYRLERVISVTLLKIAPLTLTSSGVLSLLIGTSLLLIPRRKVGYNGSSVVKNRQTKHKDRT